MSSKLVVEFYDVASHHQAVATVLAFHGGDNPESAALTLVTLLSQVPRRPIDAGALAARFIIWQQSLESQLSDQSCPSAILMKQKVSYGYQLARIHMDESGPLISIVRDDYTKDEEMEAAESILQMYRLQFREACPMSIF
jgi:hypothetical protein